MCHADIGDNRSIRLCTAGQVGNLAKVVHTHFDDRSLHRLIQLQQGFGQADPIVKVALGLEGFKLSRQHLRNHFLGGSFADAAGYPYHPKMVAISIGSRKVQKSLFGVFADNQLLCRQLLAVFFYTLFIHQRILRLVAQSRTHIRVSVKDLPAQRHKQAAFAVAVLRLRTGIGGDGCNFGVVI